MRTYVRIKHLVEIWAMEGEAGTTWTPACLSCGWVGEGGARRAAEAEGSRHEAERSASITVAGYPRSDLPRPSDSRSRRAAD